MRLITSLSKISWLEHKTGVSSWMKQADADSEREEDSKYNSIFVRCNIDEINIYGYLTIRHKNLCEI